MLPKCDRSIEVGGRNFISFGIPDLSFGVPGGFMILFFFYLGYIFSMFGISDRYLTFIILSFN